MRYSVLVGVKNSSPKKLRTMFVRPLSIQESIKIDPVSTNTNVRYLIPEDHPLFPLSVFGETWWHCKKWEGPKQKISKMLNAYVDRNTHIMEHLKCKAEQ